MEGGTGIPTFFFICCFMPNNDNHHHRHKRNVNLSKQHIHLNLLIFLKIILKISPPPRGFYLFSFISFKKKILLLQFIIIT